MKDLSFDDLIPGQPKKKASVRDLSFDDLVPQGPEDPGMLQAMGLGVGRGLDKLWQGGKQAVHTVGAAAGSKGSARALEEMAETEKFRDEGYAPLQKQRPYATMAGEAAPLLAVPMGGSLKAAAAFGALPGLLEYGTTKEKLTRAAGGAAGSGIGYGIGKAIGAVASPGMKAVNPEAERLAKVAAAEGIPLDAAQVTGNPVLQNVKAGLQHLPWTSSGQAAQSQKQGDAYYAALLRQFGEGGTAATPDVLADASRRIGGDIQEAAQSATLKLDDAFVAKLADIETKFVRRLPTDQKAVIRSYLDDMTELIGKDMPGDVYQSTRSELGRLSHETDNQTVKHAAKQMQKALDDAFDRQASPEMVAQMGKARGEYSRYSTVSDAVKGSRAQDGRPSPKQVYAHAQSDIPGFEKGAGGQFADIARAGRQFLPDQIPNSGTAQRQMMMNVLTAGSMGGIGATSSMLATGDPTSGAMLGLAGFGTSKAAQKLMNSPQFTQYLLRDVLNEEQKRMLAQALGKAGLLGIAAATE
jgi:hypothetical protein